jgi:hypothetical protein
MAFQFFLLDLRRLSPASTRLDTFANMVKPASLLSFSSLFFYASCSPSAPETTPRAVLKRTLDNDPAFRGYTSTLGSCRNAPFQWRNFCADLFSGSPLYCNGDYTYSSFGNIAGCCTEGGVCHPATDCGTDYEGSTRAIKFQGGETLTWYEVFHVLGKHN